MPSYATSLGYWRIWVFGAVLFLSAASARAEAGAPSPSRAQALFELGLRAMDAGMYSEACPKLAESWRLEPQIYTRFYLAECYENTGKLASAWLDFWGTSEEALKAGDSAWGLVAAQRAQALSARLSYLTVHVPHPVKGLVVKRDGVPIDPEVPIPVDPGEHRVDVTAPNKQPFETSVEVAPEAEQAELEVPRLASLPPPPKPPPVVTPEERQARAVAKAKSTRASRQKTFAWVAAGVGVVGLVAGGAMVWSAKNTYDEAAQFCGGNNLCTTQRGVDLRSSAITRANLAMIPLGIGVAGLGVGLTLWLTAPSVSRERPVAGVSVSPHEVALKGSF